MSHAEGEPPAGVDTAVFAEALNQVVRQVAPDHTSNFDNVSTPREALKEAEIARKEIFNRVHGAENPRNAIDSNRELMPSGKEILHAVESQMFDVRSPPGQKFQRDNKKKT